MSHLNFHTIVAKNNADLGHQLGERFRKEFEIGLGRKASDPEWGRKVDRSQDCVEVAESHFPHLVEELEGYARGARADFRELWALSLEDELSELGVTEKCTTIVTNGGRLIGHNEDWEKGLEDSLCLLKKTVGDLTIFEFYYYNTLGGNAAGANSNGFAHTVNSLTSSDRQRGVPRNMVARWLSETSDPDFDFRRMAQVPRSSSYGYNLVSVQGDLWCIEATAKKQSLLRPETPFVHTNHYTGDLKTFEATENSTSTYERYEYASKNLRLHMSVADWMELSGDISKGPKASLLNERTVGRMGIDFENRLAHVWLRREAKKGWVAYPLDFLGV